MHKKAIVIFVVTLAFCIAMTIALKAQSTPDPQERLTSLESKLQDLRITSENAQKEISGKLDRVLSNQDEILRQLEIVKVRATRK